MRVEPLNREPSGSRRKPANEIAGSSGKPLLSAASPAGGADTGFCIRTNAYLGVPANLLADVMPIAQGERRVQNWFALGIDAGQSGEKYEQHSPQETRLLRVVYFFAASQLCSAGVASEKGISLNIAGFR